MGVLLWIVLPVFVAAGSALLAAIVIQARMEVSIARERAATAEARALLQEQVRTAEEAARRKALDEFLADIRVEQRLFVNAKTLVVQERLYFRNLPLSEWSERKWENGDSNKFSYLPPETV